MPLLVILLSLGEGKKRVEAERERGKLVWSVRGGRTPHPPIIHPVHCAGEGGLPHNGRHRTQGDANCQQVKLGTIVAHTPYHFGYASGPSAACARTVLPGDTPAMLVLRERERGGGVGVFLFRYRDLIFKALRT